MAGLRRGDALTGMTPTTLLVSVLDLVGTLVFAMSAFWKGVELERLNKDTQLSATPLVLMRIVCPSALCFCCCGYAQMIRT